MQNTQSGDEQALACTTCEKTPPGFFERYKGFFFSSGTLIAAANTVLMVLGFIVQATGRQQATTGFFWLPP